MIRDWIIRKNIDDLISLHKSYIYHLVAANLQLAVINDKFYI